MEKEFETELLHLDPEDPNSGAIIPPICLSTIFRQESPGVPIGNYDYSRTDNPNRRALEKSIALLEGSSEYYGCAFSSGSAALLSIIVALGDNKKVIVGNDIYGGTRRFFQKVAVKKMNMAILYVDIDSQLDSKTLTDFIGPVLDEAEVGKMDSLRTQPELIPSAIFWIETPSNPRLKIADIRHFSEVAHRFHGILVVDNTFMTPYLQNPLTLGADIVVHSASKAINGHYDSIMGISVTKEKRLHEKIKFMQNTLGAIPSPFECYQVSRGLKTLCVRMKEQATNASWIVQNLRKLESARIKKILYPSNELQKQHHRNLHGSIFSVEYDFDSDEKLIAYLKSLELFTLSESLGGVVSLVQVPYFMSHAQLTPEEKKDAEITTSLVRFSVGLENPTDLLQDLANGLSP